MQPIDEALLYEKVGTKIRELRGSRKQGDVAEAAGVLRTSITNIEKGRQKPPLHVLYRICAYLRIEPCDLMPKLAEVYQPDIVSVDFGSGTHKAVTPKTAEALEELQALLHDIER